MITEENYLEKALVFRDRQAGISLVYDHDLDTYSYNAYLLEKKLLKEIVSHEFEFLEDALVYVNAEFGQWTLEGLANEEKKGCSTCAAKK